METNPTYLWIVHPDIWDKIKDLTPEEFAEYYTQAWFEVMEEEEDGHCMQQFYNTVQWQAWEKEADEDREAGRYEVFESMDDFIKTLDDGNENPQQKRTAIRPRGESSYKGRFHLGISLLGQWDFFIEKMAKRWWEIGIGPIGIVITGKEWL